MFCSIKQIASPARELRLHGTVCLFNFEINRSDAAKDVNKHKIEKINRFIKETKKEIANNVTDDVYDVVTNQAKMEILEEIAKLIK